MGKVYRATELGREVAIKALASSFLVVPAYFADGQTTRILRQHDGPPLLAAPNRSGLEGRVDRMALRSPALG